MSQLVEFSHLTIPAHPTKLSPLRRHLRRCLCNIPQDRRDEIVLAVSEAVTNSVTHAYEPGRHGTIEVTLWTESEALWIEVRDHGQWRVPAAEPRPTGHGLGIRLMQQLFTCVLIHHDRHGTQVLLQQPLAAPVPDRSPLGRPADRPSGEL
ncbi:ATP-binding protein [Pseudonocardia sp. GCM10023141]|uniref:ATP-binding protein n=1 Tax=Pseudonocardia sp. GCM10023141 TaxID=3252653 RepID=UPI003607CFE6